jgi:hypothetical protein
MASRELLTATVSSFIHAGSPHCADQASGLRKPQEVNLVVAHPAVCPLHEAPGFAVAVYGVEHLGDLGVECAYEIEQVHGGVFRGGKKLYFGVAAFSLLF